MYLGIGSIEDINFHVRVYRYDSHNLYFLELKTIIPKKELNTVCDKIQRIYPNLSKSVLNYGQESAEIVVWGIVSSESLKSILRELNVDNSEAKLLLLNLSEPEAGKDV